MPKPVDDMHPVFVLWDIDHTLIENGGVSKENYENAFAIITGTCVQYAVETDGRTDPEIIRNMLVHHGIESADVDLSRTFEALEQAMAANKARLRERGHAMPGAHEATIALHQISGIVQSVLTGNIRPNAVAKLSAFGLDTHIDFDVGAYGSDDNVRSNLVGIARERALKKYGVEFDRNNTVLIGDTTRDVRAAIDGDARIIAVATGIDNADDLANAGADVVLPNLRDTSLLMTILKNFGQQAREMASN